MAKLRKMLGRADSPYIVDLMALIETQSHTTIANWAITYATERWLPIYEKSNIADDRLRDALKAAQDYLDGTIKLAEAKKVIKASQAVAKELADDPVNQAAARAISVAASTIHMPTGALGMVFYGAATVAYDSVGLNESATVYDQIASEEGTKVLDSLRAISVENESHPVNVKWHC